MKKNVFLLTSFRLLAGLLLTGLLLTGCVAGGENARVPVVVVLSYEDFGPQAMAHEALGMQWWQWQKHGDSRPAEYDIKIAVYQGNEDEVKRLYPVVEHKTQDYRYITYQNAINYLESAIDENALPIVTERLMNTRTELNKTFYPDES